MAEGDPGQRPASGGTSDVGQLSDAALVRGIARGSHEALAEVYGRHGARAHALAERLYGPQRAGSVVQQVFLRLWRTPEDFDSAGGSLSSYLSAQVHGQANTRSMPGDPQPGRGRATGYGRTKVVAVDDATLAGLAGHRSWALLDGLGAGQRRAIVLAYFGGHTYKEVARMLGRSEESVRAALRDGLSRLSTRHTGCRPPPRGRTSIESDGAGGR